MGVKCVSGNKKHPMALLLAFFAKREKAVEERVCCQNAYSFHIEPTDHYTHSVFSSGTQDSRI